MPSWLRLLGALAAVLVLAVACSQGPLPGSGDDSGPEDEVSGDLAAETCWTGARLGSDPQDVLQLSRRFRVPYLVTARAVATWPTFARGVACSADHAVEVYKVLRLPTLDQQIADYATLLRPGTPLFAKLDRAVERGCMSETLGKAAAATGLSGAVMAPVLPESATIGWAPAPPDQWEKGRRVFACTLTWETPVPLRYRAVFTKQFPTGKRTCIDSRALVFVDCARRHDRERIAVIEARDAVAAAEFPGPKAIRKGPSGRYLSVSDARWKKLDAACTSYLRAISTTKKLTGIANVDVDEWPAPGGSYPIYCEADTRPDQDSLITEGSVYNRG